VGASRLRVKETGWECGMISSVSEQGKVEVSCGHSNELLGSTKCREILEWF
jgi:hypothetical protein